MQKRWAIIGLIATAMVLGACLITGAGLVVLYETGVFKSKPDLVVTTVRDPAPFGWDAMAVVITNHEKSSIRIDRVLYNGERDAVLSSHNGLNPSTRAYPFVLASGESQEFRWKIVNSVADPTNYDKEIRFVEVHSDRGTFTYDRRDDF